MDTASTPQHCAHTGGQLCSQCSWVRPTDAVLLVIRGRTARRALPVAVVVGTILSAVNQGTVIAAGDTTAGTWITVAVNFVVPYLVASVGYLSGRRVSPSKTPDAAGWRRYLAEFHDQRPAVTEHLLARADRSPYRWLG